MYTAQTLYPWTGAGEGGTQNRQIQDTSAGTGDTTTKCNFGTSTTQTYILAKPLTTNSTTGTPASAQNFGWNVLVSDMNHADTSVQRYVPAGTWTFTCALTATTLDTTSAYTVQARVHKRSSGGTLTEIFNAEAATQTIVTSISVTITKTGVSEIVLNTGETIHVEYWVRGKGVAIFGQTITFNLGTTTLQSENTIVLPSPGIRSHYFQSYPISMAGSVLNIIKSVKLPLSMSCTGTAFLSRLLTLHRLNAATATGALTLIRKVGLPLQFVGTGTANVIKKIGQTLTFSLTGNPNLIRTIGKSFTFSTTGIAGFSRLLLLHRLLTSSTTGISTFARALILRRGFSMTMFGLFKGWIKLPFDSLPTTAVTTTTYSRGRVVNK